MFDPDTTLYPTFQDQLEYELQGEGQVTQYFYVNPETGVVTTKKFLTETDIKDFRVSAQNQLTMKWERKGIAEVRHRNHSVEKSLTVKSVYRETRGTCNRTFYIVSQYKDSGIFVKQNNHMCYVCLGK